MKPTYEEQMDYAKQLAKAVQRGRTEDVKTFLPFLSPTQGNRLLCYAVEDGYTDIVKVLIAATNPKENNSIALSIAAHWGHVDIVKLLIPVSDPKDTKSTPLFEAVYNGHTDCIRLLIPVSNVSLVLKRINSDVWLSQEHRDVFKKCIEDYENLQQKERLIYTLEKSNRKCSTKSCSKRKI